jgi:hypothetical protein
MNESVVSGPRERTRHPILPWALLHFSQSRIAVPAPPVQSIRRGSSELDTAGRASTSAAAVILLIGFGLRRPSRRPKSAVHSASAATEVAARGSLVSVVASHTGPSAAWDPRGANTFEVSVVEPVVPPPKRGHQPVRVAADLSGPGLRAATPRCCCVPVPTPRPDIRPVRVSSPFFCLTAVVRARPGGRGCAA